MTIKIAVGSKAPSKINSVANAARAYWQDDFTIVGHDVPSNVSEQPLSHEETQQGAINRAHAALAAESGATLGIGLEGGVVDVAGQPVLMGYIAATDGTQTVVVPTTGVVLPVSWSDALKNGAELRPLAMASGLPFDNDKGGTVSLLTNGAYDRERMFTSGVLTVLAPFINARAYSHVPEKAAS